MAAGRFYSVILVILGDKELLLSSSSSRFPGLMLTGSGRVTLDQLARLGIDRAASIPGRSTLQRLRDGWAPLKPAGPARTGEGWPTEMCCCSLGEETTDAHYPYLEPGGGLGGGQTSYLGAKCPRSLIASGPRSASCSSNSAVQPLRFYRTVKMRFHRRSISLAVSSSPASDKYPHLGCAPPFSGHDRARRQAYLRLISVLFVA